MKLTSDFLRTNGMNIIFRQWQTTVVVIAALSQGVAARAEPHNTVSPISNTNATQESISLSTAQMQKHKKKTKLSGFVATTGAELKAGENVAGNKLKGSIQQKAASIRLQEQQAATMDKNEPELRAQTPTTATSNESNEDNYVNEPNGNNNQSGINENGGVNEPNGDNNQSGSNN